MKGFVITPRIILDDPIFKEPFLFQLYYYCVLKANHEDKKIIFNERHILIKKGSFISGRKVIANDLGINETTVRARLKSLQKCGYILLKPTNKFTIVSVYNYESCYTNIYIKKYFLPSFCQQNTTNNNEKNEKNIYNIDEKLKKSTGLKIQKSISENAIFQKNRYRTGKSVQVTEVLQSLNEFKDKVKKK
jgi:biotin operon repressor